jgi:hypothetical protein
MYDDLKDAALEAELCSQAANVTAGECRLVLLIGEFDRRRLWAEGGFCSCAHFLNWRVGTSLGAAREQVRVGRGLAELSFVRAAFASGELSYSKVRAITRVATPELEESLVELARHATASQLEQIVREYRRADPEEQNLASARHETRYLRTYTDDDGMVVISARLSPEDGAVVLAAIEAARASLAERDAQIETPVKNVSAETSALSLDVSAETREQPATSDPWSEESPRAELALEEPLQLFESAAADALVALCASVLSRGLTDEIGEPAASVLVHVDAKVLHDPSAEGCAHIEGVGAITGHVARRLACDGAVSQVLFGAGGSVEAKGTTRVVPRAMRRALKARDRGCRWPGCTTKRHLHAHHIVFWSKGGPTTLSNLVAICHAHHRLVHEGGWDLRLERSGAVTVFTPDGVELPAVPAPGRTQGPGLAEVNRQMGLRIDQDTCPYGGERFDLGLTVDALLSISGRNEYCPTAAAQT